MLRVLVSQNTRRPFRHILPSFRPLRFHRFFRWPVAASSRGKSSFSDGRLHRLEKPILRCRAARLALQKAAVGPDRRAAKSDLIALRVRFGHPCAVEQNFAVGKINGQGGGMHARLEITRTTARESTAGENRQLCRNYSLKLEVIKLANCAITVGFYAWA